MSRLDSYITPFAEYFGNDPKYISNKQIAEYFEQFNLKENPEAVRAFVDYYKRIGAQRYVLRNYARELTETRQEEQPKQPAPPEKMDAFLKNLRVKKYSPRTVKAYTSALLRVNAWMHRNHGSTVDALDPDTALQYFLHMNEELQSSYSTVRAHRFAVEYYFHNILKKRIDLSFMNNMRGDYHLPTVLSKEEILAVIRKINNLKHRLMISLLYSSGLRISEVVNLKAGDVSIGSLTLRIKQGKGRKDRITIFSENLKESLLEFMEGKSPGDYLFTSGREGKNKLSTRTVQKVFKRALERSGIQKDASCHDLRHSFASHLLENGTDIRYIQQLLGHKNISTTTIYTKVAAPALKGIKSPL